MRRTKAPRDPINTMCPCVPVPPHLPSVRSWSPLSPLSQSFLHPAYCSFLTCFSDCYGITWVPQPHHVPVPPRLRKGDVEAGLIPQQWVQPYLDQHLQHHRHILEARTLVSRKAEDPGNGCTADPWRLPGPRHLGMPGTPPSGAPTNPQGPRCLRDPLTCRDPRDPVIWGTHPTPGDSVVQLIFNSVSFYQEKLDTAKKKGILVNSELNNVCVCHIQYIFKLTHCIQ